MSIYEGLLRHLLFQLDPETAHKVGVNACRLLGLIPFSRSLSRQCFEVSDPRLRITIAGIDFQRPVGLAAGWDKNGRALNSVDALGFGFAEIGSISARASQGNPLPRLFRLPQEGSIVVNYGLPNDGAKIVAERFEKRRCRIPLGVNVVKTNDGPDCSATDDEILCDYIDSVALLHRTADYLMLNLSCPNAEGGKDFFAVPGNLERLLRLIDATSVRCPVFLKVPPTDSAAEHDRWLTEVEPFQFVRGFMFNLAPGKPGWLQWNKEPECLRKMPGAVAGPPVAAHMLRCINGLSNRLDRDRHVVIGGGGISTADDAWQQICHGASLLQIYSSFVYQGPAVVRRIHLGLLKRLEAEGIRDLSDAVGCAL